MPKPPPTEAQILLIRQEWSTRTCDTRAWAEALDVSLETIRRIGRGDTYRTVGRAEGARPGSPSPRASPPASAEPSPEEISASLDRLAARLSGAPVTSEGVDSLIEELTTKGKENRGEPS